MTDFDSFYNKIIDNPSSKTEVVINGKEKTVKGMVMLTTKNYPDNQYIKIMFDDGSFLLTMIQDKEIYYADKLIGCISSVKDVDIGRLEKIEYEGKVYELGNRDDYQYVLRRYVGGPNDVEGEASFSDYFPVGGPKEFLSLGWLSETGERADINCKIVDVKDIQVK